MLERPLEMSDSHCHVWVGDPNSNTCTALKTHWVTESDSISPLK